MVQDIVLVRAVGMEPHGPVHRLDPRPILLGLVQELLFLYKDVLQVDLGSVPPVVRARTPDRLPVVLSRDEVVALLKQLTGTERLIVMVRYGSGRQAGGSASICASRISTSIATKSSCGKARARRIE